MGTQGLMRVTPTHIQALCLRYRRLAGALAYYQRTQQTERAAVLAHTVQTLGAALQICAPDLITESLAPIRYRPPRPLPGAKFTRALFSGLRRASGPLTSGELAQAVATAHGIELLDAAERVQFEQRTHRAALRLQKQGLLVLDPTGWQLQA